MCCCWVLSNTVALRKESVDRNVRPPAGLHVTHVALRKESVDRNNMHIVLFAVISVALRKESVDRNHKDLTQWFRDYGSLSARRAWIEIQCCTSSQCKD